jgi:hypothetical protein
MIKCNSDSNFASAFVVPYAILKLMFMYCCIYVETKESYTTGWDDKHCTEEKYSVFLNWRKIPSPVLGYVIGTDQSLNGKI